MNDGSEILLTVQTPHSDRVPWNIPLFWLAATISVQKPVSGANERTERSLYTLYLHLDEFRLEHQETLVTPGASSALAINFWSFRIHLLLKL